MLDSTQQVIFRFSTGTLDQQGFSINAEIHTASEHLETDATLPPHPALQSAYEQLRERYQQQCCGPAASFRSLKFLNEPTHLSIRDTCNDLTQHLDAWLESPEFKPIREDLLHHLNPAQPVRFLIRTNNATLQWLPWHFCHLLNRYQYGGIALCLPQRSHHIPPQNLKPFVRVLPILGDSTGIDIQADLELLKDKLPHDAQILDPLVGITCAELGEKLWQAEADILFFAGHSSSTNPRGVGELYLNKTDSVTISELRNALTKAIQKGLKLAIFNSCDGLKLAADLADLNLPATIVMREPIPDAAAQFFLEAFLTSFADPEHPKPISLAVREAQERLQHLEQDFPFASGLPVLCQQTDSPDLTWQDLRQKEPKTPEKFAKFPQTSTGSNLRSRYTVISILVMLTGLYGFILRPQLASYFAQQSSRCINQKNLSCAIKSLNLALFLNQHNPEALVNMAYYYELVQQPEQVDYYLQLAINQGSPTACNNKAFRLMQAKQYDRAESLLYTCQEMRSESTLLDYAIHKNLGWINLLQGQHDEAKEYLLGALSQYESGVAAHCLLAQVEDAQQISHLTERAIEYWEYCRDHADAKYPEELEWKKMSEERLSSRLE
jgi:tetratricopeptide (TPR) repeat protein